MHYSTNFKKQQNTIILGYSNIFVRQLLPIRPLGV
jgi:hypothetical protein